jgi:hypothetical protein
MFADKHERKLDTFTYSRSRALAAGYAGGVILTAYAHQDQRTDVSLVELAKFSYTDDNAAESKLRLESQMAYG